MSYSDLIKQEGEYTYSANIQFDMESDTKLLRFIPNETTISLLKEYFTDLTRTKANNHARILYGSYGTGKSHLLTVLSQVLSKSFTNSQAFSTFVARIREHDIALANDIDSYVNDEDRKPSLIVPIVFDFEDFDRCIYFSLKKKLDALGVQIRYKTFYDQAALLLQQWKSSSDSSTRLLEVCSENNILLNKLEEQLNSFDPVSEQAFSTIFSSMTFGVKYVYEVTNLADTINQATKAISGQYSGIVFIFDEFGRYMEDNIKKIKVKSVQDLAEYCDHSDANNHLILVSHREISLYTQHLSQALSSEWKKVEGRFKAISINSKQDQCLSLIRSVLVKDQTVWDSFKTRHAQSLSKLYAEAFDFRGFLVTATSSENPFEGCFPLHPIALYVLDRLAKRVAQNDRTFFTYLAGKDDNSLYRFLGKYELDEFHYVGVDEIFDYFEPSIQAVQSDDSYEWYRNYQAAISKNKSDQTNETPEVRILKVIAVIGIINDPGSLTANKVTIQNSIDCPNEVISNALDMLCEKKIIKYSGVYDRYDFFDASIFDVDAMIAEESRRINDESAIKALNEHFIQFVLYPHRYNRVYKINRVFVPLFVLPDDLMRKNVCIRAEAERDGLLVMLVGNQETSTDALCKASSDLRRTIIWANNECIELLHAVKQYIAAQYLETQKAKYLEKDPAFDKELQYHIDEISVSIENTIEKWKSFNTEDTVVVCNGNLHTDINSSHSISELASEVMFANYPYTLIVNNELINKNSISPTINAAKKNAIRAMLNDAPASEYFTLTYLSPDYITVRSVLAKNGFIAVDDDTFNMLENGMQPQKEIKKYLESMLTNAGNGFVEFSEIYNSLKQPPYGLRDGYLSLLLACILSPYKKTLIISSHGTEQELTVDLFDDIVHRPQDYSFTIANWSMEQLDYLDKLEMIFHKYIDQSLLAKSRLKAICDGMSSHYKSLQKYSRTTQINVSNQTLRYRQLMERTYASYSTFFFAKLKGLTGDYSATISAIETSIAELETATTYLKNRLRTIIVESTKLDTATPLSEALRTKYEEDWSKKKKKAFDYYTNAFLEYVSTIASSSCDDEIIERLAKSLAGIELSYWSDKHVEEFEKRFAEIVNKLDEYVVSDVLLDTEVKMTLTTAAGVKKELVFNNNTLSPLGMTVKNKLNATFTNFGLAISYDEKVQIILSMLNDLMEGK